METDSSSITLKDIWEAVVFKYTIASFFFDADIFIQEELIPDDNDRRIIVQGLFRLIESAFDTATTESVTLVTKEAIMKMVGKSANEVHITINNVIQESVKVKYIIVLSTDVELRMQPTDTIVTCDLGYIPRSQQSKEGE